MTGKCDKCYACDVVEGPLECAKRTIKEYNCEGKVIPILSNGFDNVPYDANVAVISGMGYETMKMILEANDISHFKRLILQANNDVYDNADSTLFDHAIYGCKVLFEDNMIRRFIDDDKYDNIIRWFL